MAEAMRGLASAQSGPPFWMWWVLPVVATGLVAASVALVRRGRGPRHGFDSTTDYAQFRDAMARVRGRDEPRGGRR